MEKLNLASIELSDAERDLAGTSNISIASSQSASPTGIPSSRESQLENYNSIANSSFALSNSHIVASHNQTPDRLGLQLLLPNDDPAGDIIFVHGLGGSALKTWSWKRDVANFWPTWLGDEDELSSFRIFSFGYKANFKGAATNLNTIDFANDLLFSMLSFSGRSRDGTEGYRTTDHNLERNGLSVIDKTYPLFGYATIYWAYHVSNSPYISEGLQIVLKLFLEKYSLSWIEAISVLGNMGILTRSAQYLKAYSTRRSRGSNADVDNNLLGLHDPQNDMANIFGSWANDFIHIVGKFGRNIAQHPPSIYRLVPPFCPQRSMVGIAYRITDSNSVSVAGLPPDEGWSDCLSSVNVGQDETAYKVVATDAYFITLITRNGTAVIWNAETCEEARRIRHNEYVMMMVLNRAGTRLATAGTSTYRVWDISSGKELYRLPKTAEERTMTVAFGHTNSELLIGSSDPLNAPELVRWQADGKSVVILCFGTEIFEWDLYKDEQTKYDESHNINTREMTTSADGSLLLTSSNAGTISVWTLPRMQLIYRLVNVNAFIRDITFSPSGQRFYDTRESVCNVWEPDALVRLDEHDLSDASALAESFVTTEPVVLHDESSESQVSAFATGPDDMHYCCGKEDGSVTIHEAAGGTKVRKMYGYGATSTVLLRAWSKSGRYIVSCDDSGHIISKRLEVKSGGKWAVFPGLDIRIRYAVPQFVFSNDEKLLLISTSSEDFVWDLKKKVEICSRRHEHLHAGKWIADPTNAEIILFVSHEAVHQYKWMTLECSGSSCLQPTVEPINKPKGVVRKLALTKDGTNLVYEVIPSQLSDGLLISAVATSSLNPWTVELPCQLAGDGDTEPAWHVLLSEVWKSYNYKKWYAAVTAAGNENNTI
ncbi:hypothetical protein V500_06253 [Pseudogymnoascus sp. VKM F-4518 (FW-2643)]|nr:hypothetical protein V500_06253 [Pseudogymnoascus sp. VKM F-4518 (FW-2643)]